MNELIVPILESFLGEPRKHNESRGQISFDCPICSGEKNMSDGDGKGNLEINYYKGVFRCWACEDEKHMHGGISSLINRFGTKLNKQEYSKLKPNLDFERDFKPIIEHTTVGLPEEFISLKVVSKDFEYKLAMQYLKERNIGADVINKFNLGYCTAGKYANRIIIPSYDENGCINYFSGRAYKDWVRPKYLNPDDDKKSIIFNEYLVSWDSTIYLVEGPFDHLTTPNSIPLLGKSLKTDFKLFHRLMNNANAYVVVVLDPDAVNNMVDIYNLLNTYRLYDKVRMVKLPDGYDISKIHEVLGNPGVVRMLKLSSKKSNSIL